MRNQDNKINLSVVMPAYQEEENLRFLLPRINQEISGMSVRAEIIVVDTPMSLDDTQNVCKEFGVKWVPRKNGDAYGDAVRTGIESSMGEYVIFMDADGSHAPEWISKLYSQRNNQDVVIASRYVENGFTENSLILIAMSRLLNFTYSIVLGIKCKDISNSYRLYHGEQIRAIQLTSDNFEIVEEILLRLTRQYKPLRVLEIPFTFKQRLFGKSKRNLVVFIFTYIYTLLKLRIRGR